MFQGSKGGSSSFKQTPDNLRSNDTFEGVLGLCVGPIKGPVRGLKSIKLDDTAIENETGELNFANFTANFADGDPLKFPQKVSLRLGAGASPVSIGGTLKNTTGSNPVWITRTLTNVGADFVDLRFVAQQMFSQTKKGIFDIKATIEIQMKPAGTTTWINPTIGTPGTTYNEQGLEGLDRVRQIIAQRNFNQDGTWKASEPNYAIVGKTTGPAVYELRIGLPNEGAYADVQWDIRCRLVERETYDADPNYEKRNITWESMAAVYGDSMGDTEGWRGLAWLQIYGLASDQLSGVPEVTGVYDTKIISVPSSAIYNPETRVYSPGVWDGSWAYAYTNDPAWVVNNAISDSLSGISLIAQGSYLNKWDALEASKWFSELVPDGNGGTEPRYSMNLALSEPQKAEEFVRYMAGAVGALAWDQGNGEWRMKVDKPEVASDIFTLDNIEGEFVYSHTDIDTRYNDIIGQFKNAEMDYRADAVQLFDNVSIARIGRKPTTIPLIGCTSRQEAMRRVKLRIRAAANEHKIVTFTTNRRGRNIEPLSTILIADGDMGDSDARGQGRVVSISADRKTITVRDPLRLEVGVDYALNFAVPNPNYTPETSTQPTTATWDKPTVASTRAVVNTAGQRGSVRTLHLDTALPASLDANAVVSLVAPDMATLPRQFRVTAVVPSDDGERVSISAINIDPDKWDAADNVSKEDTVFQDLRGAVPPPTTLDGLPLLSLVTVPIEQGTQVNLRGAWVRPTGAFIAGFQVQHSINGGPMQPPVIQQSADWELVAPVSGTYKVEVRTRDRAGGLSLPLIGFIDVEQQILAAPDIKYDDGKTVEELKPAQPGATEGMTDAEAAAAAQMAAALALAQQQINDLEGSIEFDPTELNASIDLLNSDVAAAQSSIAGLQSTSAAVQQSVGTLQQDVLAAQSSISTINGQVGSLSAQVGTVTNDIGDVTSQLGTAVGRITATEGEVDSLQSLTITQGSLISQNATAISNTAGDLAALNTRVSAGRVNLLEFGSFELGSVGWLQTSGFDLHYNTDWGTIALLVAPADGTYVLSSEPFPVTAEQPYTISADTVLFSNGGNVYVDLIYQDAVGNNLFDGGQTPRGPDHNFSDEVTARGIVAHTSYAPTGATRAVARFVASAVVGCQYAGVRQIKVEKGTAWSAYTNEATVVNRAVALQSAEGQIASLTTRVGTAESSISSSATAITNAQGSIATLQTDVVSLEGSVSTLQSSYTTLNGTVSSLSSTVSTQGGSISSLQSVTTTQGSTLAQHTTDIATANANISTNATAISTANGNLASLTTRVGTAEGSVSTLQSSMTSANGSISTLQSNVSSLNGSVTTLQQSSSTQAGQISTLQQTVATQGSGISTNAQAISTTNSSLASLTTQVYAAGNPNLLRNGSAEMGLDYWSQGYGVWTAAQGGNLWGNYFYVAPVAGAGDKYYHLRSNQVGIQTGGVQLTFTCGADVSANGGPYSCYLELRTFNGAGTQIGSYSGGTISGGTSFGSDAASNRPTLKLTTPVLPSTVATVDVAFIILTPNGTTLGAGAFRQAKLEVGTSATPYSGEATVQQAYQAYSTLNSSFATLSSTVSSQGGSITTLQSSYTSLNGTVTSLSSTVSTQGGQISSLQSVQSTQGGTISTLQTQIRAGGGNLLVNTDLATGLEGWDFGPGTYSSFGVNLPSTDWTPAGENSFTIHQNNTDASALAEFAQYVAVEAGKYYDFSCYCASHRCLVEVIAQWWNASGGVIYTDSQGAFQAGSGGTTLSGFTMRSFNVIAPTGATRVRFYMRKHGTTSGGDSYAWFVRPQVAETRATSSSPVAYSVGSARAAINNQAVAISTINSQYASLSGTVSTQGASISSQATAISTLQGDQATLSSTVATHGSSISNLQTATSTLQGQTATLITQVTAGSPNLLRNGGFELGNLNYWNQVGSTWSVYSGTDTWGSYAVNGNNVADGAAVYLETNQVNIERDWHTLTADAGFFITGGSGHAYVELVFRDSGGNTLSNPSSPTRSASFNFMADGTGRRLMTVSAFAPVGTVTVSGRIVWYKASGVANSMHVRQVKLERGAVATPYSSEATIVTSYQTLNTLNSQYATLSSTVSIQGVTITSQQTALSTINGQVVSLFARAAVMIEAGDVITGWENTVNGNVSSFKVRADNFELVPSTNTGNRVAYSDGTFRIYAGSTMTVWGAAFGSSNQFIEWTGPVQSNLSGCTEINAIKFVKTNGQAYYAGGIIAGTLKASMANPSLASSASAVTGVIGSNGNSVAVNGSYSLQSKARVTFPASSEGVTDYNAALAAFGSTSTSDGGFTHEGVKANNPASGFNMTIKRDGGTLTTYSTINGSITLYGFRPIPGDAPGFIDYTYDYWSSVTTTDPTPNTSNRSYSADFVRSFGYSGSIESQRISVTSTEW